VGDRKKTLKTVEESSTPKHPANVSVIESGSEGGNRLLTTPARVDSCLAGRRF
jgi:hypothetical protein